jgi:hypothetical protein
MKKKTKTRKSAKFSRLPQRLSAEAPVIDSTSDREVVCMGGMKISLEFYEQGRLREYRSPPAWGF